jgi:hypothetical protein
VARLSCCCTQSELMGGERKVAMLPSEASHVMGQGQPPMLTVVLGVRKGPEAPKAPLAAPPIRVKFRGPWNWMLKDDGVDEEATLHDAAGSTCAVAATAPRTEADANAACLEASPSELEGAVTYSPLEALHAERIIIAASLPLLLNVALVFGTVTSTFL